MGERSSFRKESPTKTPAASCTVRSRPLGVGAGGEELGEARAQHGPHHGPARKAQAVEEESEENPA